MRRTQAVLLAGILCALALPIQAAERFRIDPAHSHVGFSIRFTGLTNVEGKFADFFGTLMLDEADLTRSSVTAIVRPQSIQTGVEDRDNHLRTADFFDVEKFPIILLQSKRVEKQGNAWRLVGNLTMHGVTREVAFPLRFVGKVTDAGGHQRVGFDAALQLKRSDFGITGGAWWEGVKNLGVQILADEVEIRLQIQANQWNWDRLEFNSQEKPSIGEYMAGMLEHEGVKAAVQEFRDLRAQRPGDFNFSPDELNLLGRRLLAQEKVREAIEIFKLNVEANPNVSGAYVALADAYLAAGNSALAKENYRKALELDTTNTVAMEMLRRMDA